MTSSIISADIVNFFLYKKMYKILSLRNVLLNIEPICARTMSSTTNMSDKIEYLSITGNRKIAYKLNEGKITDPTIVFVPGFMSTMEGFKAQALQKFCHEQNRRYIRFDFEGMGKSPGNWEDIYIGQWIEDLKCVIENLVPSKALLVGSSMGGWFSLKVGQVLPDKLHSILMIAPAINFFTFFYDFFYKTLSEEEREILDSGKVLKLKKNFGEIFLRKSLMEESKKHHLDLNKPIPINVPIRILHGVLDPDVPYKQSLKIMEAVTSTDVDVTYRKNGKHQMSEEADLKLLLDTLKTMLPESHVGL